MTVVAVGIYSLDLFMAVDRLPKPGESITVTAFNQAHGGKAANQAVAAARLGVPVSLITNLGDDANGGKAVELFQQEGISLNHLTIIDGAQTGISTIILDLHGQQLISTFAGASGCITMDDIRRANKEFEQASVLLLQGEIEAEITLEAARLAGSHTAVVLDPSPIETFEKINGFDNIDILTPNEHEAKIIVSKNSPTAKEISRATGVPTILLTRGEEGVEMYHQDKTHNISAPKVEVIDTTGAGDAFNGSLAAGLHKGLSIVEAARIATNYAAICVTRKYCIPSYPTKEEFEWV